MVSQEKVAKISFDLFDASKVKTKMRMETSLEGEKVPLFRPFFMSQKGTTTQTPLDFHLLFHLPASPYSLGNVREELWSRQKFLAGESPSGK